MDKMEAIQLLRGLAEAGFQNERDGARGPLWAQNGADEACEVLGLDPDNYRARDNDNWPLHVRGRLTEPRFLLRHVNEALLALKYPDVTIDERVIVIDHPEFADRYTAIIDGECEGALAMSSDPFHPQGIGLHAPVDPLWVKENMAKRVMAADLPDKVKLCIRQDMVAYDEGD